MLRKYVLIVDDEELIREFVSEQLEVCGYPARHASNGVEAVLHLLEEKDHPGLILMDVSMPRLNGVDALRIMKKIAPEIPVVMFTGHVGSGEMAEAVRLGAVTCLSKPFRVGMLEEILGKYCA